MTKDTNADCEVWAALIGHMLHLAEPDQRRTILDLALAAENKDATERANGGLFLHWDEASIKELMDSAFMRYHGRFRRYQAAVVCCFVREITNDSSPEDAGKLLFGTRHQCPGSGYLADYIDDLPRGEA